MLKLQSQRWCSLLFPSDAFKRRVADWFASLNNKMGGDLKKIQTVGDYFVEVWQAVGMQIWAIRCGIRKLATPQ